MAGPMDGGWRVVALWDSAEQFQAFLEDRLHLTLERGGGQPTITVWGLGNPEGSSVRLSLGQCC